MKCHLVGIWLSVLSGPVLQDFLKHKVWAGTRTANLLWSERGVGRDCFLGMSVTAGFGMHLPVGYGCAERHHLSLS